MRIALDARTLFANHRRGTGKNLIDLYNTLCDFRPDWQVLAYHRSGARSDNSLHSLQVKPRHIEMPGDRWDAWGRWRLPRAARRDQADVLHCPANTCPRKMSLPTVVTIHDLIPLDMPAGHTRFQVRRFIQSIQHACRFARHIVTPSQYTKDRLLRDFNAQPEQITVNPWAADSALTSALTVDGPESEINALRLRLGLSNRPYVIHLGAESPRKNTRRLIEAWAMIDRSLHQDWTLLVVGLSNNMHAQMTQLTTQLHCPTSVNLQPFVSEQDLGQLLHGAEILAYPSLSEGFGLPILDAWQTHTAVLTSNTTSLPEVAGQACVMVDPTDTCDIAQHLQQLINDPYLRYKINQMGQGRLRQFSWRQTALTFASVIEKVAGTHSQLKRAA